MKLSEDQAKDALLNYTCCCKYGISPVNCSDEECYFGKAVKTLCYGSQGEWIPVNERLPADRDWYLGVFREPDTGFIGLPYICDYVGEITKGTTKEGWILRGFTDIDDVVDYMRSLECVAWQPLPEPYKKGGAE